MEPSLNFNILKLVFCYILQLLPTLWLVNFFGHILLYRCKNLSCFFFFIPKCLVILNVHGRRFGFLNFFNTHVLLKHVTGMLLEWFQVGPFYFGHISSSWSHSLPIYWFPDPARHSRNISIFLFLIPQSLSAQYASHCCFFLFNFHGLCTLRLSHKAKNKLVCNLQSDWEKRLGRVIF